MRKLRQEVTVEVTFFPISRKERDYMNSKRKAALIVEGKENDQSRAIFNNILLTV